MYKIVYTNRMKKDVRLMKKRGKDIGKLTNLCIKSLRILLFFRLPQPAVMRICLESKGEIYDNVIEDMDKQLRGLKG